MPIFERPCVDSASRAERRRLKVIETARRLFIENGFHATGIARIACESGIAVGQIYRDFSSKEEIVAAIVHIDCGRFMTVEALETAIRAGDTTRVVDWLLHLVEPDDDLEGGRLFAEIVAEASRNPRVAAIFETVQDELRANLLAALNLLAPGDEKVSRRAVTADLIMTLSLGLLHHQLLRPDTDVAPLAQVLRAYISEQLVLLGSDEG